MATQGVNAAAHHADVAQQQLHNRGGTDDLRAVGVMRPAQCVQDGTGFIPGRGFRQGFRHVQEIRLRRTADGFHHFRGVAADMGFQQIKYAARVDQGIVAHNLPLRVQLVSPGATVILAGGFVITAEQPVGKSKIFPDDQRGVGKFTHILMLDFVIGQQVTRDTGKKRHIATRTQRRIKIGHGGGTVEAWVDHHQLRAPAFFGFHYPFEAHRVRFGGVTAHDQNDVGVANIDPVVGHRATSETRRQRRNGRAVAQARLVLHGDHP